MDERAVTQHILENFAGVETTTAYGYTFFFYRQQRKLPFATLAPSDNEHDRVSNLDRPGVFRLNIGVRSETYRSLFGPPPKIGANGTVETGHDFTTLDRLMPHPHYAPQSWVCVLNPGDATLDTVKSLLAEAYELAAKRDKAHTESSAGNKP
jgi:hypothetical protein